jgi:putative transposase
LLTDLAHNLLTDMYAYCLLPNHFHFLLRLKTADEILANPDLHDFWPHTRDNRPHQFFSNFFNGYARAFNEQYGRTGSLFQRPFGRIPVPTDAYFHTLVAYIHRNPQKHGLTPQTDERRWTMDDGPSSIVLHPTPYFSGRRQCR